jgi:hypothetical protein
VDLVLGVGTRTDAPAVTTLPAKAATHPSEVTQGWRKVAETPAKVESVDDRGAARACPPAARSGCWGVRWPRPLQSILSAGDGRPDSASRGLPDRPGRGSDGSAWGVRSGARFGEQLLLIHTPMPNPIGSLTTRMERSLSCDDGTKLPTTFPNMKGALRVSRGMKSMRPVVSLIILMLLPLGAWPDTRGVGVYPGDPQEDFGPVLVPAGRTYRNLALHRPAYHSSSYDYNLTAQLVTDGIKEKGMPRWVVVSTSQDGVLKKQVREHVLDHNVTSTVELKGSTGWIQLELAGGDEPLEIDRLEVTARAGADAELRAGWTCAVMGSADGQNWAEAGRTTGADRPGRLFQPSISLAAPFRHRFLRVELAAPSVTQWRVCEVALFDQNKRVEVGGPDRFYSAWKSAGSGAEWVYVDLGASCTFNRVVLSWVISL